MEYRDPRQLAAANPSLLADPPSSVTQIVHGVPEEEVQERIKSEREAVLAEAEERLRTQREQLSHEMTQKLSKALAEFAEQKGEYFRRLEGEIVQLSLAIARKILEREASMDPTLLAGLVRIALDRMQCASVVRVRISETEAAMWRSYAEQLPQPMKWDILSDPELT